MKTPIETRELASGMRMTIYPDTLCFHAQDEKTGRTTILFKNRDTAFVIDEDYEEFTRKVSDRWYSVEVLNG